MAGCGGISEERLLIFLDEIIDEFFVGSEKLFGWLRLYFFGWGGESLFEYLIDGGFG